MAFKSVETIKKSRRKRLGTVRKAKKSDGFYLKIDDDCDLILYVPESGEYYKVLKASAKPGEGDEDTAFLLEVDLDKPQQVEFKTRD
jgi:hypothetical protein